MEEKTTDEELSPKPETQPSPTDESAQPRSEATSQTPVPQKPKSKKGLVITICVAAVVIIVVAVVAGIIVPRQNAEAEYNAVKSTLEEYTDSTLDLAPATEAISALKQSGAYDLISGDARSLLDKVSSEIEENADAFAKYADCKEKYDAAIANTGDLLGEESARNETLGVFESALNGIDKNSRYYKPIEEMKTELTQMVESATTAYATKQAENKARAAGCESSAKTISYNQTVTENDKCEFSISQGEWVDSFRSDALTTLTPSSGYRFYVVKGAFKNLGSMKTSRLKAKLVFNGKYTYETKIYYDDGETSGGIAQPMANCDMSILCGVPDDVASSCSSIAVNFYINDQISDWEYMSAKSASYAMQLQ